MLCNVLNEKSSIKQLILIQTLILIPKIVRLSKLANTVTSSDSGNKGTSTKKRTNSDTFQSDEITTTQAPQTLTQTHTTSSKENFNQPSNVNSDIHTH